MAKEAALEAVCREEGECPLSFDASERINQGPSQYDYTILIVSTVLASSGRMNAVFANAAASRRSSPHPIDSISLIGTPSEALQPPVDMTHDAIT